MGRYKIKDIATSIGNSMIDDLIQNGWQKSDEYNVFAMDKGIDFDSYTLSKESETLYFEWTNWFEWEIVGDISAIESIANKYQFSFEKLIS